MTLTPTDEQQAIIDHARNSSDNIIVQALAGAAKTTTLVMVSKALARDMILCLAFNKRIATEMKERLPGNCEALTLNSLGHRAWMQHLGRGLVVDARKSYSLLRNTVEGLSSADRDEAWETFADTLKAISLGKSAGWIPRGRFPNARRLIDNDEEFFGSLETEPSPLQERLIRHVTIESIELALAGQIDFDDQIFMPTLFSAAFPLYPVTLIDEAQDLSSLNHYMLKRLVRKKRLIAVGDERQAIYAFRGAHETSMGEMKQAFSMKEFVLSISFRCPRAVVEHAQWRAPHMKAADWAEEGRVTTLTSWSAASLPEECAIICRNNAPIFALAMKLLRNGRYCTVYGAHDTVKSIIKAMKKFNVVKQEDVLAAIDKWEAEQMKKTRVPAHIEDKAEVMRIFARQAETLSGAIAHATTISNSTGKIELMTGHKAKGFEFDHVFILDKRLIGHKGQEPNVRYVMQTRAKKTLTYIDSEDFCDA